MSLTLLIYLISLFESLKNVTASIIIGSGVFTLIIIVIWCMSNDGYSEKLHDHVNNLVKRLIKKWWVISLLLIINIFTPSKTTMYLMLGAKYLSDSNIPSQVSEILNLELKDILDDLKKSDEKTKRTR